MNITLNTVYSKIVEIFGEEGFILNNNIYSRKTISKDIYNKSKTNIKDTIHIFILGDFIAIKSKRDLLSRISFDNINILKDVLIDVFKSKGVELNLK